MKLRDLTIVILAMLCTLSLAADKPNIILCISALAAPTLRAVDDIVIADFEGANEWRWMFGVMAVPSLVFLLLIFLTPQIPRLLAVAAICWLLGPPACIATAMVPAGPAAVQVTSTRLRLKCELACCVVEFCRRSRSRVPSRTFTRAGKRQNWTGGLKEARGAYRAESA